MLLYKIQDQTWLLGWHSNPIGKIKLDITQHRVFKFFAGLEQWLLV